MAEEYTRKEDAVYDIYQRFADKDIGECPFCQNKEPKWLYREEWKLLGNNSVYFNNTIVTDGDILFLKKGINIFESSSQTELSAEPYDCAPLDTVVSLRGDFSDIKHVSGEDNAVLINVFDPVGGLYALNLYYSNNAQSGEHSYNVELVERYARVVVNSKDYGTVFFRNTYSWDTYASKLIYVYLESGDNIISLFNDKSYSPDGEASYLPLINTDRIAIYKMIV